MSRLPVRRGTATQYGGTPRRRIRTAVVALAALAATALATPLPASAQADGPPRPTGPCDLYAAAGTPCVAAHSTTRALYASYDGPLYQVKRQSDGAIKDIGVVQPSGTDRGGYADAAAQDAFCANTVCWITILYDQSPNHNDLTQAPRGGFSGPALGGMNNLPIADMAPITIGGHKAYGVFIEPGMGLRNNNPTGTAVDDQPEDTYWVVNGRHYNDGCCFDYGNAEIDSRDDGDGTMETTYFGNATAWYHGPPPGPWVMTDQENNLVGCVNPGSASKLCPNLPSVDWRFTTGVAKGEPHHWASLGGNAQSGPLQTMFDGPRVGPTYDPMRKQGAILLGNGGDNSNASQGTFYEGVMTSGFPADSVDQSVQANIAAAKYDVQQVSVAPPPVPPQPVTVGRVPGKYGSALSLDGTSNQYVNLPHGIVSSLHDFTISAWVNPGDLDNWSRVFDFGSGTGIYMFLTVSAGGTNRPRFAITVNSNGAEQALNAPDPLPIGQWTNVTITLSGTTGRMYVNGVQVDVNQNMTLNPSSLGDTSQNYIGKSQWPDPLLNASVDDFQIYSRALSDSEIAGMQTAPGAGDVASYKFDEAGGTTVVDSSGNHHDGTVVTPDLTPAGPPGLQTFAPGTSQDTIVTFTNTSGSAARNVKLGLSLPAGWSAVVDNGSDTVAGPVAPGDSVSATFKVTSGPAAFNGDIVGTATWTGQGADTQTASMAERVRNTSPLKINEYRIGTASDATNTFIELYNAGASPVDLSGWTLTEHPTQQAIFSTVKVPAGVTLGGHGFYLLGLSNSGLAAPASAGDSTLNVRSTTGMSAGDTVDVDTGSDQETRKIVSVGSAASGNTTLWQPLPEGPIITVPAGSTSVPVTSTSGFAVDQKVSIGFGDKQEVATVTAVGKPGTQTRLTAAAPAGTTNLKVLSNTNMANFSVGDRIRLDINSPGHGAEWVTVAGVGTAGPTGTGLTLAAPLQFDHANNLPFNDAGTGISFTPATAFAHSSNEPVQPLGTGITLDSPLSRSHAVNAVVRDAAVTSAGYQGAHAPNQWFGGPALSSSAGSMVLRDAGGNVADSLNYGLLVDPWAAEGYQAASGSGQEGCVAGVPARSGELGRSMARFPDGADNDSNCTDFRAANGNFSNPTPGTANFATTVEVPVTGTVGGTVPATLALALGTPASFGAFTPGVDKDYTASTTATVTSTAGDATLSVSDPDPAHPGHLVNGSFFLPQALQASANTGAFAPVSATPTALLTYGGPVSNDMVAINFKQSIARTDPLRTGTYGKTLTFTLSTTNP
jgi:alpha-L-arabinofuranosidase B-like protein/concanavalin A-like lectin/glucanase superfamily protein/lamin tail-like protein/alpha-galactosidase-like protein